MQMLHDITEQLAATVLMTEAEDLPALANLHEQLRGLLKTVDGQPNDPRLAGVSTTAAKAARIVEQIILRETDDAKRALESVCESIAQVQQLLSGAAINVEPLASPAAPAPEASAASPTAAAHGELSEADIKPDDLPLIADFIAEATGHLESAEAELLRLEDAPDNVDVINAIFRSFHTVKGVAGFLNLRQIGALAHAAENLLDLARKADLSLTPSRLQCIFDSVDLLKSLIAALDVAAKSGTAIAIEPALPALLKRLHAAVQHESTATPEVSVPTAAAPAVSTAKPEAEKSTTTNGDATVKVSTTRLDTLIDMVGELVIAQAMVTQDMVTVASSNQRLGRNMSHLGKITRELQDLSMSMRMVPIQGVFQKMARLVRDLARKSSKSIDFEVVGAETELDRNLVEAISDPLVHMVRNAADHGIEMPDDRERAGKNRNGRIQLRAYHQAGNIVIEITDDGKGLNKARIIKKAVDAGIIIEGQELTEQEVFKLIFHPGLSTAEKITEVSGRGVGMDVVRRNVEALRGRIDIASQEGHGSTFAIRLPLTLAVIDGLVTKVGPERYIVPITSIEQSLRPTADQISTVQGRGEMCMVRGALLPLVRLHRLFNVTPRTDDPTQSLVVIVQDNSRRCCFMVDELLGQQQVVIKSLGQSIGQVRGVSGGAILGDGNVSLILDVPGIIDVSKQ